MPQLWKPPERPETVSTYFPQQPSPHRPEQADAGPERHLNAPALDGATCAAREPAAWTLPVEAVTRLLTPVGSRAVHGAQSSWLRQSAAR